MSPDAIREAFEPWRRAHTRKAWKPIVGESSDSRSWFGGLPLAPAVEASEDEAWPVCEDCGEPMRLLLQLDLAALPEEFDAPVREGVLQVFYCGSDDGSCETWQPFSGTHHLRIVEPGTDEATPPGGVEPWDKVVITGFEPFDDVPDAEEHERLGVEYTYDFNRDVVHVKSREPAIELEGIGLDLDPDVEEIISEAAPGDKLGGWPMWVQGPEYPVCPECEEPMEYLFQVDSEDHLDHMFGDAGCGHVTQCRQHPQVLAFGWAGS